MRTLRQAGQSGNDSECTLIEICDMPAMLTQLAWVFVSGTPSPYPWKHSDATAETSTCLFSATHLKIISRVLYIFPLTSFSVCGRFKNPSSLGQLSCRQFQGADAGEEQTYSEKCTDGLKEYGGGGHEQCHKISNILTKEYSGWGRWHKGKLWGCPCSLLVTFEASGCPLGSLSYLHIIQFSCASLGHGMLEMTLYSFLWCEKQ